MTVAQVPVPERQDKPPLSTVDPEAPVRGRAEGVGGAGVIGPRLAAKVGLAARAKAYVALTKPRIVELLLVTTVPAMIGAAGGVPKLWLIAVVLVGGSLAAGAANALNCYIDRDIDEVMRRTSRRPLPAHSVAPRSALIFGLALALVSISVMAIFTNLLATVLTAGAIAYYDVVYTLWLKRRTPQSTFWGGICGAAPVLIGWAAVTGSLSWAAVVLFGVVFFWQLPHFYALALRFADDYARAGVPMLPVVASARRVGTESVLFAWLTLIASLVLVPLGLPDGHGGVTTPWIYGAVAALAGSAFVAEAHRMAGRIRRNEPPNPMRLFHWSTTYLTIVFVAVAVSALLGF